jgi:hypothetical protein
VRKNPLLDCFMEEKGDMSGVFFPKKIEKYFGSNVRSPIFAIRF